MLLSPRWIQAYARAMHIFFLLPDFCRPNYPRRKQLHRRMKYFPTSLSLSHPSIPAGTDAKKYFAKTKQRQLFFRMRRYFLEKREGGRKQQRDYAQCTTVSYRESLSGRSNCHWNCVRFAGEKGKSAE